MALVYQNLPNISCSIEFEMFLDEFFLVELRQRIKNLNGEEVVYLPFHPEVPEEISNTYPSLQEGANKTCKTFHVVSDS